MFLCNYLLPSLSLFSFATSCLWTAEFLWLMPRIQPISLAGLPYPYNSRVDVLCPHCTGHAQVCVVQPVMGLNPLWVEPTGPMIAALFL